MHAAPASGNGAPTQWFERQVSPGPHAPQSSETPHPASALPHAANRLAQELGVQQAPAKHTSLPVQAGKHVPAAGFFPHVHAEAIQRAVRSAAAVLLQLIGVLTE